MANFELVKHLIEGTINTNINSARQTQGAWEWFNALYRIVSQQRFTGTVKVYGPALITAETEVEATGGSSLFGVLLDNAMAAEDAYLALANLTAVNWTAGISDSRGYLFVPRASQRYYVFAEPDVFNTALTIEDILGTEAGLEAGTGSTSGVTVMLVYTK